MHRVPGVLQKIGRGFLPKEIAAGFQVNIFRGARDL